MKRIAETLNDYLRGAQASSLNASIARYMIANLDQLAGLRVSDVAAACYVSSPTIIRFVRSLGFDDFTDFKDGLVLERAQLDRQTFGTERTPLACEGTAYHDAVGTWTHNLATSLDTAFESVDISLVRELAVAILSHRHVFCVGYGLSSLFGNMLANRLVFQGKGIVSMGMPSESMPLSDEPAQTLVIVVSQFGNFLRDTSGLPARLRSNCDELWLVTQVPEGSFNEKSWTTCCGCHVRTMRP